MTVPEQLYYLKSAKDGLAYLTERSDDNPCRLSTIRLADSETTINRILIPTASLFTRSFLFDFLPINI